MHSKGEIRGGYENFFEKFSFFSAKSPFFHHQNLKKKALFVQKSKKIFLHSRDQIRGGDDNFFENLLFNAKYAIFDH